MKSASRFIAELFRRKVVRLMGAYIALFWLFAQGYASLYPGLGLPEWSLRAVILGGIALAPVLALLSWKYDLVPPRLVRDAEDVAEANPAIRWARARHENTNGSFILLRWEEADGTVREKRFFKPVGIGRGAMNDVDLPDERVSRHHAVLWAEGGAWHIRDLESGNGTYIDRVPVSGSAMLPQSCDLRFHIHGPVVQTTVDNPLKTVIS